MHILHNIICIIWSRNITDRRLRFLSLLSLLFIIIILSSRFSRIIIIQTTPISFNRITTFNPIERESRQQNVARVTNKYARKIHRCLPWNVSKNPAHGGRLLTRALNEKSWRRFEKHTKTDSRVLSGFAFGSPPPDISLAWSCCASVVYNHFLPPPPHVVEVLTARSRGKKRTTSSSSSYPRHDCGARDAFYGAENNVDDPDGRTFRWKMFRVPHNHSDTQRTLVRGGVSYGRYRERISKAAASSRGV